jgi:hypothetical protein
VRQGLPESDPDTVTVPPGARLKRQIGFLFPPDVRQQWSSIDPCPDKPQ